MTTSSIRKIASAVRRMIMCVDKLAKRLIRLILPLLLPLILAMAPVSAFGRESADLAPAVCPAIQ